MRAENSGAHLLVTLHTSNLTLTTIFVRKTVSHDILQNSTLWVSSEAGGCCSVTTMRVNEPSQNRASLVWPSQNRASLVWL